MKWLSFDHCLQCRDAVLVSQSDGSTTTDYTQDQGSPLTQILQTTQGSATTNYFYTTERLGAQAGSAGTWYVRNALGSMRMMLDNAGVPQGVVTDDPPGTPESGAVPTFGFTGALYALQSYRKTYVFSHIPILPRFRYTPLSSCTHGYEHLLSLHEHAHSLYASSGTNDGQTL